METLTFKSIKAIADNLDFSQTASLTRLLIKRLNQMKLVKIKEALIEKFQTHNQLTKFIPLVEKIDDMSVSEDTLKIHLNDVDPVEKAHPGYRIIIDQHENNVDVYFSKGKESLFVIPMFRENDPVTYDYLSRFGDIFLYSFSLQDDDDLGWGVSIMNFLSLDNPDTDLILHE